MKNVRAKKHLGQHFLLDQSIAKDTVDAFAQEGNLSHAVEVGPGMGVLTRYLLKREKLNLKIIDIDRESIEYLLAHFPLEEDQVIFGDFLNMDLYKNFNGESIGIIGNFPYNISSQILFKALESKDQVLELVGMFQKEVAERVVAGPGSRTYGIISVLLQAYYDIEYLFTIEPDVFNPPPKVKSAVIRLKRNKVDRLDCDEKKFKSLIKMAFNQRRKTLRNSLKSLIPAELKDKEIFNERPEQLGVQDFIDLVKLLKV